MWLHQLLTAAQVRKVALHSQQRPLMSLAADVRSDFASLGIYQWSMHASGRDMMQFLATGKYRERQRHLSHQPRDV